jgi:predicted ATP-dependent protease
MHAIVAVCVLLASPMTAQAQARAQAQVVAIVVDPGEQLQGAAGDTAVKSNSAITQAAHTQLHLAAMEPFERRVVEQLTPQELAVYKRFAASTAYNRPIKRLSVLQHYAGVHGLQ